MDDRLFFAFAIAFALVVMIAIRFSPEPVNSPAELEAWRQSLSPSVLQDMP